MARYTGSSLQVVPARGHEALPQGRALLVAQVRHGTTRLCAWYAWSQCCNSGGRNRTMAQQLREKQRARASMACSSAVPSLLWRRAAQRGQTGANLLTILERRLDNVVYRLGLADSRARRASSSPWALQCQRQQAQYRLGAGQRRRRDRGARDQQRNGYFRV